MRILTVCILVFLASAVTGFVPSASKPTQTRNEIVQTLFADKSLSSRAIDKLPTLTEKQSDFTLGYLNKHHEDLLTEFAKAFSPVGTEMAKANAWSGGSYVIERTEITAINTEELTLKVTAQLRGKKEVKVETVSVQLDADPIPESKRKYLSKPKIKSFEGVTLAPIDCLVRKLCRLCWMVQKPEVTGKLIQLACQLGGENIGKLPENMYLNQ